MPLQKTSKEEIIKKAVDVFRKNGYYKTSMADLAEACGLLKGSFYYYFKSKEELMHAALQSTCEYYSNKVFCIAYDTNLSAKERFIALFNKQAPFLTDDMAGCLFGNMTLETISANSSFQFILQKFFSEWKKAFATIFELEHEKEFANILAEQSVMELEGALMMMRLYNDKKIFEDACVRVLEKL